MTSLRVHACTVWFRGLVPLVAGWLLLAAGLPATLAEEPTKLLPPLALPERPLSDADLARINKTIAEKGSEIRLNREITSQLGITKGDELLLSRGIAVKDEGGGIHEFEPLPDNKGFLVLKLTPQLNTIYWVDRDFLLRAALSRVPGRAADEMPAADAKDGMAKELAYWAGFARGQ
jgi:hypothetical protein